MREHTDGAASIRPSRSPAPAPSARIAGLIRRRGAAFLGHRRWGQPIYTWLLWAAAAGILAACPMLLSDPAMWAYLLDPELLALVVIIGVRYTRWEIDLLRLRLLDFLHRHVSS